MKTSLKIGGLVAAMMLAVSGASFAADQVSPYVHSSDGKIVKSGYGLCSVSYTHLTLPTIA